MRILRGKVGIMNSVGGATATGGGPTAPTITTSSPLTAATYSEAISTIELEYTGGGTPTWSVTAGALIAGLSLNASTGEITGTPTEVVTNKAVTIQVENEAGNDSKEFTQTSALPSALSGAILILRAAAYDEDTGDWVSDVSPATYEFNQATESARPAEGSDAGGALVDFGGDDYVIGNAATKTMFNGLSGVSILGVVSGLADEATYIVYSTSSASTSNGVNLSPGTTGSGVIRVWDKRATTVSAIASTATSSGIKGICGVSNINVAPRIFFGSTAANAASASANSNFDRNCPEHWVGSSDTGGGTPGLFFTGEIRTLIYFNKACSDAEVQAAMEYLQGKSFFGSAGITLWA